MAFPTGEPTLPYKSLNDGSSDFWTQSASGTAEYYYNQSDLSEEPLYVEADGSEFTEGTLGSLAQGEYGWGDNDSLGSNTLYVRLTDDTDPDSKAADYVQCSEPIEIYRVGTGNLAIVGGLAIENNSGTLDANIRMKGHMVSDDSLFHIATLTLLSTDSGYRDSTPFGGAGDSPNRFYLTIHSDIEDVSVSLSGSEEAV